MSIPSFFHHPSHHRDHRAAESYQVKYIQLNTNFRRRPLTAVVVAELAGTLDLFPLFIELLRLASVWPQVFVYSRTMSHKIISQVGNFQRFNLHNYMHNILSLPSIFNQIRSVVVLTE